MEYITKDGDRWDLIAYKMYGDPYLYDILISANSDKREIYIFGAGIKLNVPIVYIEPALEENPPWQVD